MFHSMDPNDESRIVFREVEEGEGENEERTTSLEAYAAKKHRLWKSTMDAYLGRIDGMPDLAPHVLSIYGVSTDSPLAGLRYDPERREISFQWEQTLNNFIIECGKVQQKVEVMCEGEPTMDEEAVIAKYGEERGWHRLLVAILRIRGEAFRRVRRERVAKRYREVFGKEFEIESLNLKHERRQIRRIQWAEFREAGIENMSGVSVEAEEEVREIDRNELGSNGEDLQLNHNCVKNTNEESDIHDWSDDSDDNYLYRRMDSSDEETEPDSADDSDDGVVIANGHTK